MTKEELALKHIREVKGLTSQWSDKEIKKEYEDYFDGYIAGAEPREKRIAELEAENERIKTKYYELQDTLKKVRLALIKERTANIMNYGKGGVEMFDSMFEILKGVSN